MTTNQPFFFSPTNERRGGWGKKEPGSPLAVKGLFPLSFSFFFFPGRELGPPPPAQTRTKKGDTRVKRLQPSSPSLGINCHWQICGVAEIAVVRRMRMRRSVMGFGLPLVEKGRLEISRRAVLWELLEGVSDLRDPANGKLGGRVIGGLKVFCCWPMVAVDITSRSLGSPAK